MDGKLIEQILKEDIPDWDPEAFPINSDIRSINNEGLQEDGSVFTEGEEDDRGSRVDGSVRQGGLSGSSIVAEGDGDARDGLKEGMAGLRSHRTGRVLKHAVLTKVANQMVAGRGGRGSPTCIARARLLAVGTSKGLTFLFDLRQLLRFCVEGGAGRGAVSSLSFSRDSSRLLVAFAEAHINMWDVSGSEGRLLRSIAVHQGPGAAVSFVRFLPEPTTAVYADTSGSVFQLTFRRGLTGRTTDLDCFFSGCRGEILCLEPLMCVPSSSRRSRPEYALLGDHQLLAMASFTKMVLVASRPRLKVIFMAPLTGRPDTMPHLCWSLLAPLQDPLDHPGAAFLTFARDNLVQVLRVAPLPQHGRPGGDAHSDPRGHSQLGFSVVLRLQLDLQILSVKWLNQYVLAVVDFDEQIHAIDSVTETTLEVLDLRSVQLVYNRSLFRSTATGGHVSEAMAAAAERACYHSVMETGGQLKILGQQGVHLLSLRQWTEAVSVTRACSGVEAAFRLCVQLHEAGEEGPAGRQVLGLPRDRDGRRRAVAGFAVGLMQASLEDAVGGDAFFEAMLELCLATGQIDFFTGTVYERLRRGSEEEAAFARSLVPLVLSGLVESLHPEVVQRVADLLLAGGQTLQLDRFLSRLSISCIDLDQMIKMAEKQHLFSALIHIHNSAFRDYLSPIVILTTFIRHPDFPGLDHEVQSEAVILAIVYIHCCFAGKDYFNGEPLPDDLCERVKTNMFEYLVPFAKAGGQTPLDLLLQCNTNELLNMLSLAFEEDLFTTDLGASRKQATVQCLCDYFISDSSHSSKQDTIRFFVFLSRELTKPTNVCLYIDENILDEIFEMVCLGVDDLLTRAASEGDQGTGSGTSPSFLQRQVETALMTFLRPESRSRRHWLESDHVLSLSRKARLHPVCEHIYRERRMLHLVLECVLQDPEGGVRAFQLIEAAFADDEVDDGQRAQILRTCIDLSDQLIAASPSLSAVVLLAVAGRRPEEVIADFLPDRARTAFLFLRALFAVRGEVQEEEGGLGLSAGAAVTLGAVKISPAVAEAFIGLLCRFEPDGLPFFLRQSVDYRSEVAASSVASFDLPYSLCFLQEKMRKFDDACALYLQVFDKLWLESVNVDDLPDDNSFLSSSVGRRFQECINRFVSLIKKYKAHSDEVERLWVQMLDRILDKKVCLADKQYDFTVKAIFTQFVKSLSSEVPMPVVLITVLKRPLFSGERLGSIKDLLLFMMRSFNYESLLLESCIAMVDGDVLDGVCQLRTVLGSGVVVADLRCCLCRESVARAGGVVAFRCGHRFHGRCLGAGGSSCGLCRLGGPSRDQVKVETGTPPPPSRDTVMTPPSPSPTSEEPVRLRLSPPNYLVGLCR